MPHLLKLFFKILLALLLLLVLATGGTVWYVESHKRQILGDLITECNKHINGRIVVGEIEPELFMGFPSLYLSLKKVTITDSSLMAKGQNLLTAGKIEVSVNFFSILRHQPDISKINLDDGSVYLYAEADGRSNLSRFWRPAKSANGDWKPEFKEVGCSNMRLVFENTARQKYFDFNIQKLKAKIRPDKQQWLVKADVRTMVNACMFSTVNGSYLKDKIVDGKLAIEFDPAKSMLTISGKDVQVGNDRLQLAACFNNQNQPAAFVVDIRSEAILLNHATALLPPDLAARLNVISIEKPIAINTLIKGRIGYRDTPFVTVNFAVKDNSMKVPKAAINNCTFDGQYTNFTEGRAGFSDAFSRLKVNHFQGIWGSVRFNVDKLEVSEFDDPFVSGSVATVFPLKTLAVIPGLKDYQFNSGTVAVKVSYKGRIAVSDNSTPQLTGKIDIRDASMTYKPAGITFPSTSLSVLLEGKNLMMRDGRVQLGKSVVHFQGPVNDYIKSLSGNSARRDIGLTLYSKKLYLDELSLLVAKLKNSNSTAATAGDKQEGGYPGHITVGLTADTAIYGKMFATDVKADLSFAERHLAVQNATMRLADGRLQVSGNMDQQAPMANVEVKVALQDMNVQQLFRSFNNLGQSVLTEKNFNGRISGQTDLKFNMLPSGVVQTETITGKVDYSLNNVRLTDFEPIQFIGKTVFPKRDFRNIVVKELKGTLQINGEQVQIVPVHIASNVLAMDVDGVFGMRKGTDVNIAVPLRNPEKDEGELNDSIKVGNSKKGIVLHFKAADDPSGKIKVVWVMKQDLRDNIKAKTDELKSKWRKATRIFRKKDK